MINTSLFYKDDLVGAFSGNILESIARLFPQPLSHQIEAYPAIPAQWSVYERITWEGAKGYRYYVSAGTSINVLGVMSSIYQERHRSDGYPGIFDGTCDGLPKFCLNIDYERYNRRKEIHIDEEYFVVWLPEKADIRPADN